MRPSAVPFGPTGGDPEPSEFITGEQQEVHTLAEPGGGSTARQIEEVDEVALRNGAREEVAGHPPATDEGLERCAQRAPIFTRSSAMTQPCTMSEPAFFWSTLANIAATSALVFSGFSDSWSRNPLWPCDFTTNDCSS